MSSTAHRRLTTPLAILAISCLALVGCSSVDSSGDPRGPGAVGTADGVVTIGGMVSGTDAKLLEKSWADWEKENHIQIKYEVIKEFETQIALRAQTKSAPDLAIFPQPGLLSDLASQDLIQPAPSGVKANAEKYWSKDWVNYATTDGVLFGAPLTASVNGFIWYSPKQFADNDWTVPTTWQGLLDLTKEMQEKLGTAPWCAGFGSGESAGWPGTDWVDDIVLRQAGPQVYDEWVSHKVKFSDPKIKAAFDSLGKILRNPEYVNASFGDVTSITATPLGDVARAMGSGTCSLTHQASSFEGLLTDPKNGNTTVGPDKGIWAFMTPSVGAGGNEVTGGGEFVAAFSNDADTVKVQEYLSSAEWANSRAKRGGAISANNGLDPANASSPILRAAIRILQDPRTTFRFDASGLMPEVVGASSFRTGVVDWVKGKSLGEVLSTIDGSWPSSE